VLNPSLLRSPSARRGVSGLLAPVRVHRPGLPWRQSRVRFSPGIRLRPLHASCVSGCTWSVLLLAVGGDTMGAAVSRLLQAPGLAVLTFLGVGLGVLVHAWRHH
jgi:hypothetical protein